MTSGSDLGDSDKTHQRLNGGLLQNRTPSFVVYLPALSLCYPSTYVKLA